MSKLLKVFSFFYANSLQLSLALPHFWGVGGGVGISLSKFLVQNFIFFLSSKYFKSWFEKFEFFFDRLRTRLRLGW